MSRIDGNIYSWHEPGMRFLIIPTCLFVISCSATQEAIPPEPTAGRQSEPSPEMLLDFVESHLLAPNNLDRDEIAQMVVGAVEIKDAFAAEYGWTNESKTSLFDSVEIFSEQEELWQRVLKIHNLPATTPVPTKGLSAGLEGRVLLAVTPTTYSHLAPEYAGLPNSWTRLLAHEIIHRLHVEILDGDEEAMGPQWFYEGFAVIGSGQKLDDGLTFSSAEEALTAAADTKSPLAYRRFTAALRYFMKKQSLPELVRKAGEPGFEDWLRQEQ